MPLPTYPSSHSFTSLIGSMTTMCELCDNYATTIDKDMDMRLCNDCFHAFNPNIVIVELDEVY